MRVIKVIFIAVLSCVMFAGCKADTGTEENYIILDVRTQEEYDEKRIPGAILVPNETIGTSEIPELPDKDQMILVYCRSGNIGKISMPK